MTQNHCALREPPCQAWSRGHALGMLAAVAACQHWRAAWPSAAVAGPSCLIFMLVSRRVLTPSGRFGLANAVTGLRLALVLGLTLPAASLSASAVAALTIGILLLDLLDGWLARVRGDASVFGAHFDMETDAILVLVVTLRLWLVEGYPAWALIAGLLRYAFVLALWLFPGTGREAPRSLFARYSFLILMLSLLGALIVPGAYGTWSIGIGTAVVSFSFARSFYFSHSAS